MHTQAHRSITERFRQVRVNATEFSQVVRFISIQRRTIYINIAAQKDAKIIKLSYDDRDLLKI